MKPIKLTTELLQQIMEEFGRKMAEIKLSDGKISYTKSFTYDGKDDPGAVVLFEPHAYAKMLMLLHKFDSEVAWHGTVDRYDERTFIIKDILVYPQEVTGATVNTDQEKYQQWMISLDDETFNAMHLQGHSHVNMGVTPSGVDLALYESILEQLTSEDYYIFMIFNKRLEYTAKIYDMKNNVLYETGDVSIGIHCEDGDLDQFIKDAKEAVEVKTYTPKPANQYGNSAPVAQPQTSKKGFGKGSKSKLQTSPGYYGYSGYNYNGYSYGYDGAQEDVDYDEMIFGGRRKDWWNNPDQREKK